MAEPNFAAVAEMMAFYADTRDEFEKIASASIVTPLESCRNDIEGDLAQPLAAQLASDRAVVASFIEPGTVAAGFDPIIRQFAPGTAIDSNAQDDFAQLWTDLYDYFHAQSQSLNSRELVFTAFSGAITGSGEVIRLGIDEQGYQMAGWFIDTYVVDCFQDARITGEDGEEWFTFKGGNKAPDELVRTDSGVDEVIKSLNARDSKPYVLNPSWNQGAPAPTTGSPSTPTSLPGWTDDTGSFTNVRLEFDLRFRPTPGDATDYSLEMVANTYVYQDLVVENNTTIDFDLPYVVGVAMYREGNADGTMTIRLTDADTPTASGVSRAFTVSGQTNATWGRIWLVATPGQNNWPRNFNSADLALSFQWAGRTQGSIFLDDIIFAPMTRVGAAGDGRRGRGSMGSYVAIVGGATPFIFGDTQSATDTQSGTRGVNQYWLNIAGLGYLPSVTGAAETIADK